MKNIQLLAVIAMTMLFIQVSTPVLGLLSISAWGLRLTLK